MLATEQLLPAMDRDGRFGAQGVAGVVLGDLLFFF